MASLATHRRSARSSWRRSGRGGETTPCRCRRPPYMPRRFSEATRRVAVSVARACVPPGQRLAGAGPATVDRLEEALGQIDPRAINGYSAALHTLEQEARLTNGGRPFSALSTEEAERHLVRLADGGVGARALATAATMPVKMGYVGDA